MCWMEPTSRVFVITHPISFEFAKLLIKFAHDLPDDIYLIAPFLNPVALEFDFTSGLLGMAVRSVIPGGVKSVRCTSNQGSSDFCYQMTKGTAPTKLVDLQVELSHKIKTIGTHLEYGLRDYFKGYADTPHVKSELAKSKIYSALLLAQTAKIDAIINGYTLELMATLTEIKPDSALLADSISSIERILAKKKAIDINLTQHKEELQTASVEKLISSEEDLVIQVGKHKNDSYDTSYLMQPLPDFVLSYSADSQTVKYNLFKNKLKNQISAGERDISVQHKKLDDQLLALKQVQSRLIQKSIEDACASAQKKYKEIKDSLLNETENTRLSKQKEEDSISETISQIDSLDLPQKKVSLEMQITSETQAYNKIEQNINEKKKVISQQEPMLIALKPLINKLQDFYNLHQSTLIDLKTAEEQYDNLNQQHLLTLNEISTLEHQLELNSQNKKCSKAHLEILNYISDIAQQYKMMQEKLKQLEVLHSDSNTTSDLNVLVKDVIALKAELVNAVTNMQKLSALIQTSDLFDLYLINQEQFIACQNLVEQRIKRMVLSKIGPLLDIHRIETEIFKEKLTVIQNKLKEIDTCTILDERCKQICTTKTEVDLLLTSLQTTESQLHVLFNFIKELDIPELTQRFRDINDILKSIDNLR